MPDSNPAAAIPARQGPPTDIRVIKMGRPLADFGAEVTKTQPSGDGDPMREWAGKNPMANRCVGRRGVVAQLAPAA